MFMIHASMAVVGILLLLIMFASGFFSEEELNEANLGL